MASGDARAGRKLAEVLGEPPSGKGKGNARVEVDAPVWYKIDVAPPLGTVKPGVSSRNLGKAAQAAPAGGDVIAFDKAIVTAVEAKAVSVKLSSGGTKQCKPGDVHEWAEIPEGDYDAFNNLSRLTYANEPSVLEVLHKRFKLQEIYTFSALYSLVICNPFRNIPLLESMELLAEYKSAPNAEEKETGNYEFSQAHVWAVCRSAWLAQKKTQGNVSFIIQGESGAGKTESAKRIMLYFSNVETQKRKSRGARSRRSSAEISGTGRLTYRASQIGDVSGLLNAAPPDVQQIMMQVNPLTEALGNARTVRNDNSSRFGRFVKLFLNDAGVVDSSEISIYFLEKSRVVLQPQEERNFHIFYQLLDGLDEEEKPKYKLRDSASDYAMLTKSGCMKIPNMDDGEEWHKAVLPALTAVGVEDSVLDDFLSMLSATLLCGEVQWEETAGGGTQATPATQSIIGDIADLLGLSVEPLSAALCTRKRVMPRGSIVFTPMKPQQAKETIESIARHVFESVFEWIIALVNTMSEGVTGPTTGRPWMGVLDIFGFEAFVINSLEQLLINYCNERLQQLFIDAMYKQEMSVLQAEGLDRDITFTDNVAILTALDSYEKGGKAGIIFNLEEQCQLESGTNEAFTKACHDRFKRLPSDIYVTPRIDAQRHFEIKHSCSVVKYNTTQFREKNMDMLVEDCTILLITSAKASVQQAVKLHIAEPEAEPVAAGGVKKKEGKRAYIAGQFLKSIGALFGVLMSSEPRFVKCVKSNRTKVPLEMDDVVVGEQLHTLSILESLQTEKQGFTYKKRFQDFIRDFSSLFIVLGVMPEAMQELSDPGQQREKTVQLLEAIGVPEGGGNTFALGHSKVFLSTVMHQRVEWMRNRLSKVMRKGVQVLFTALRNQPIARRQREACQNLVFLQARYRRYVGGPKMLRRRRKLVGWWKATSLWIAFFGTVRKQRRAAIEIQRHARRFLIRGVLLVRMKEKAQPGSAKLIHAVCLGWSAKRMMWRLEQEMVRQRSSNHIRALCLGWAAKRRLWRLEQYDAIELIKRAYRGQKALAESQTYISKRRGSAALEQLVQGLLIKKAITLMKRMVRKRRQNKASGLFQRELRVFEARQAIFELQVESSTFLFQRVYRGFLGRQEARRALMELRIKAVQELRMYLDVMKLRMKFMEHKKFGDPHQALKKAVHGRAGSPGPGEKALTPQQQREAARRDAMELARQQLHTPKKKKGEGKAGASPVEEAAAAANPPPPVKTLGALLDGAFAGGLRSVADRSPTPAPARRGGNAFVRAVLEAARAQAGLKPKSEEQSPTGAGDAGTASPSPAGDAESTAESDRLAAGKALGSKSVWSALAKTRGQDTGGEVSVSSKLQQWVMRAKKKTGDDGADAAPRSSVSASPDQDAAGASEGRRTLFGSLQGSSPEITGEAARGSSRNGRSPPGAGSSPELTVKLAGPIGATPHCPGRGSPYTPLRPAYQQPSPAGLSPSLSATPPPSANGGLSAPNTPVAASPVRPRPGPGAAKTSGGYAAAAAAARQQAAARAPATPRGSPQGGGPATPRTGRAITTTPRGAR